MQHAWTQEAAAKIDAKILKVLDKSSLVDTDYSRWGETLMIDHSSSILLAELVQQKKDLYNR